MTKITEEGLKADINMDSFRVTLKKAPNKHQAMMINIPIKTQP